MKKAYFQYYETFETIVQKIKNVEQREHFRACIIQYGLHGKQPEELSEIEELAWVAIQEMIDQQRHRREINAENAKKKTNPEPTAPAAEPAAKKTRAPAVKFIKPTVEEIAAYCKEKGLKIDVKHFFTYYESNGWKVGRNAMKSWQAACASWAARDRGAVGTMWQANSTDADTADYMEMFQ